MKSKPVILGESAPVESEIVESTSPAQSERNLILEAVEMMRELPTTIGTTGNSPYSIQQNFFVTKEGRLFCEGKPFITTISNKMLDKNKALHRKFARTMKARAIVSTDDYTAYIWNEGRSLTVFYYSIEAAA